MQLFNMLLQHTLVISEVQALMPVYSLLYLDMKEIQERDD
jgi:hypothetical protein